MKYKTTRELVEAMMLEALSELHDENANSIYSKWTRILNAHFKGKVLARGFAIKGGDGKQICVGNTSNYLIYTGLGAARTHSGDERIAKVEIREV